MKISLALGRPRPLTRSEARGCLTANLALPGSGSLAAGRAVGYFQMAFYLAGFVISLIGAAGFFRWYFSQANSMDQSADDPFAWTSAFLQNLGWPLLGIGLCGFAMIWAGITSLQILRASSKDGIPPRIA